MHSLPKSVTSHGPEDWDDLRFVLAVAECGTVSEAARQIGVNHATVLRRIAAFEARNGVPLFEKTRNGYRVPPDRLRIVEALREVSNSVLVVERMMQGITAPLTGAIRLTSTDSICQVVLPLILAELRGRAPNLRFDLFSTNAHLDFGRLQADITVRPTQKLPDELFGVRAASLGFGVYRAASSEPDDHWLGIGGPSSRSLPARWLEDHVDQTLITGAADSFLILREMAAAGQGKAVLPCYLGDGDPRLTRVFALMPPMQVDLWVASHRDLADTPRIRLVRDLLADALRAKSRWLAGDEGAAEPSQL